jgi:hypothetical protein
MPHVHKQSATGDASVATVTSGLLLVVLTILMCLPEKSNSIYIHMLKLWPNTKYLSVKSAENNKWNPQNSKISRRKPERTGKIH